MTADSINRLDHLYIINDYNFDKVKFWSKMVIGTIRAKLFFNYFQIKHEKIKKINK
jgi:hypothetical protein